MAESFPYRTARSLPRMELPVGPAPYAETPLPDVEDYMGRYERGLAPYYEAASNRMRRAIQAQLGQRQRQMGEQFQARGLYGTGLYGQGLGGLYGEAMRSQAEGLGGLEQQRFGQVASRREALQNMLYGSQESERGRRWQSYEAQLQRMLQYKMFLQQLAEQRKQREQQGRPDWMQALGSLSGGIGGFLVGGPAGAAVGSSILGGSGYYDAG